LPGRFWGKRAGAAAACLGLVLAGCGTTGITGSSRATIYVSVPLRGPAAPDGRDIVDGARMALAAAGGRVGDLAVRARYLDDAVGAPHGTGWSPAAVGANARRATEDTSSVAYIGDLQSGASRTSEPITNAAHLLQVSPASGAVDLTRPFLGSDQLPDLEEEGGERTFGRVIPDDPAQATAAAAWVRKLGVKSVEVFRDGTEFGRTMALAFRQALTGVRVVGKDAQLIYYGGIAGDEPPAVRNARVRVMGSDALLPPYVVGPSSASFATSAAQAPTALPSSGRRFVAAFRERYGREPGRYAAYGYEAMAVVLASIRRAGSQGDQRQPVIDAFFATKGRHSVLGTYSVDPFGNTTLNRISGYRLHPGGHPRAVTLLPAR
jgi:branched-chain amino acid transport system substrate-binding protein